MTPLSDDLVERQPETVREIGYEEAHEIAKRFIDFFFGNLGEKPRVCIPARPEHDDDICLHSFIDQQKVRATMPDHSALIRELRDALAEVVHHADDAFGYTDVARAALRKANEALGEKA